jgi:hypothetical protein
LLQSTIICRHRSLQYDVKLLTVAFSVMVVVDILYHGRFGTFAIIVVAPTITLKCWLLGGAILHFLFAVIRVVQYHDTKNVILIVASCDTSSFSLLSSMQSTAYVKFDCCVLASCNGLLSLYAP